MPARKQTFFMTRSKSRGPKAFSCSQHLMIRKIAPRSRTPTYFSDAARDEKWAPSTFNHYRSLLMLTYREARRSGKVNVNPARDVRHRREDNSRVRYLNQFEPARADIDHLKPLKIEEARLRAVIEHDYSEHLPEFELALNTGLRKGSMYSLTWAMVDWNSRMSNIPNSKNGEALYVPLNNALWQR